MTLVETLVKLFDFVCLFVQIPDPRDPTLGPGGSFEHVQQKKAKGQASQHRILINFTYILLKFAIHSASGFK